MGSDKTELELGGRPLLSYPLRALEEVSREVVLACGPRPRYEDLGYELVLDSIEGAGPLAGLCAGLEASEARGLPFVAVLACDLPRAEPAVLRALLARALAEDLDLCLLETPGGFEPAIGVYRSRALAAVRQALEAGERKMTSFHGLAPGGRRVRVGSILENELGRDLSLRGVALNLNTLGELQRERIIRSGSPRPPGA